MELELELDDDVNPEPPERREQDAQASSADTIAFDRRRSIRPDAPKPGTMLSFQLATDHYAKLVFATPIKSAGFIGVQVLCLLLIIWSLGFRVDGLADTDAMEHEASLLQTRLDHLKSQWSESELELIEASLSRAEARVFDDVTSFAGWIRDKTGYADRLGMSMSYRIGERASTSLANTISLPVHMSLKVEQKDADNAYISALEFVRSLIDENLRLEVFGNEIHAGPKGIAGIDLDLRVWVHIDEATDTSLEPDDSDNPEVTDVAFVQ